MGGFVEQKQQLNFQESNSLLEVLENPMPT